MNFEGLPKELKQLIISFVNLTLKDVLNAQSTSKEWRDLCWQGLADFNTNIITVEDTTRSIIIDKIFSRLNPRALRKLNVAKDIGESFTHCFRFDSFSKDLCELSFSSRIAIDNFNQYNAAPCRVNIRAESWNDCEVSPKLNLSLGSTCESVQKEPIIFDKKFHRGGIIGDEFIVIGAADGTLMFLKLDLRTKSLAVHSTNNIHNGCINEIWCEQSLHTYVASSDGIVTAWDHSNDGPVMVQKFQFPEPIFFVCDAPSGHVVAAGLRTIYVTDVNSGMIIKQEYSKDDITGLFGNTTKCTLGTKDRYFAISTENFWSNHKTAMLLPIVRSRAASTPNFWVTPDVSFRGVIFPNEVRFFDEYEGHVLFQIPSPNSTQFDARPNLLKFNPNHYWVSVSTGTNIITFELEMKMIIATVSPRISRCEIDAGKFPTCHSLWYGMKGDYMFGLYSDNALYWWHYPNMNPDRTPEAPKNRNA